MRAHRRRSPQQRRGRRARDTGPGSGGVQPAARRAAGGHRSAGADLRRRVMAEEFFKHPLSLVESESIGKGTRVWAWAHVMKGARIGAECNIGEHCFIEGGVVLGDRATVKNGVAVWEGVTAEDDVFLGPHAVLTNDLRPRSKVYHPRVTRTLL